SYRPVLRARNAEDVRTLFGASQPTYVVMLERDYRELLESGIPLRIVYTRSAVIGNSGRGFRRQRGGPGIVATGRPGRLRPEFAKERVAGPDMIPFGPHAGCRRVPHAMATLNWTWRFVLKAPPDKLWPYVADTDRFNRRVGLPP